jgi:competence protein ComEA
MSELTQPRWDPATARAAAVIACVSLLLAAGWWWTGRTTAVEELPRRDFAAPPGAATAGLTGPTSAPPETRTGSAVPSVPGAGVSAGPVGSGVIVVDVRGAVRSPGIRRLPPGARVLDAVQAAGGLRPGRGYGPVNLARPLVDGEQVVVGPAAPRPPAPPAAGADPAAAPAAVVDVNAADADQLEQLDGVGPVLAGRIVQRRAEVGRFGSVEELLDVEGIGEQTLAGLRDSVTVR